MGKYDPLGTYLRDQNRAFVPMTFMDIEKVVGSRLPNSQRYPAWWSNNPFNNVMTQVWLDAGFVTEQVDIAGRKLVFRRVSADRKPSGSHPTGNLAVEKSLPNASPHPLVGWMKGTVHVPDGIDLTEPADPDWGASLER